MLDDVILKLFKRIIFTVEISDRDYLQLRRFVALVKAILAFYLSFTELPKRIGIILPSLIGMPAREIRNKSPELLRGLFLAFLTLSLMGIIRRISFVV